MEYWNWLRESDGLKIQLPLSNNEFNSTLL